MDRQEHDAKTGGWHSQCFGKSRYAYRRLQRAQHSFCRVGSSKRYSDRIVIGLVYKDGLFGYARGTVLTREGWVSVDTTWQQFPADVGHIALLGDFQSKCATPSDGTIKDRPRPSER